LRRADADAALVGSPCPMTFELLPDVDRLTRIFQQATAPTFLLGAVAGFVSLMYARLHHILQQIHRLDSGKLQHLDRDRVTAHRAILRRRAQLLARGILASLYGAICSTLVLAIMFATEILGLRYAFFAPALFAVATIALGIGLVRFIQEARIGVAEADRFL
jgi:hypothetical protein